MRVYALHDWHVTAEQARRLQSDLAPRVSTATETGDVRLVAGVDISATRGSGIARAAVVVLAYPGLELVEQKVIESEAPFPYVPGLLSFREAPLVLAACEQLVAEPHLVLVDGQGIAHPRRMGLASHLGLFLDRPTIGCAKSRLCGRHDPVGPDPGASALLVDRGEVIGAALRTRKGASPLYVSTGHKVSLEAAIEWVLRSCKSARLPEPTRLAHLAAGSGRSGGNSGSTGLRDHARRVLPGPRG